MAANDQQVFVVLDRKTFVPAVVHVPFPKRVVMSVIALRVGHRHLGFYHWEREGQELEKMARMGINLVPCSNVKELDQVHAAGMMAWMWLSRSIDAGPKAGEEKGTQLFSGLRPLRMDRNS